MDLTGDGLKDIISGSYNPGYLFLFARRQDGSFAGREKLKDKDGKSIKVGRASAVYAADWDGDEDLDLVVGNIKGEVYFVPNEGTKDHTAFGEPQMLEAQGNEIRVAHGDSGPVLADWDSDGLLDLIVGAGDGSVLFFRNVGSQSKPVLDEAVTLIGPSDRAGAGQTSCGTRTKVCVTDYNEDGLVDLLVGDFAHIQEPERELSPEEKAAAEKAKSEYDELMKQYRKVVEESGMQDLALEARKLQEELDEETPKENKLREKRLDEVMAKMQQLQETELKPIADRLRALGQKLPNRRGSFHGFVWLFLREPAAQVAAGK